MERRKSPTTVNRRQFAWGTAALAAGAAIAAGPLAAAATTTAASGSGAGKRRYCAFIKFLQSLSYDELAEKVAALGFDGVEATIRTADGYIKPADAARELPKFKQALDKRGLEITILTTDILAGDQEHAESTLRAAADVGVPRYRLGFYRYDLKRPIVPQVEALRPTFDALAVLSRRAGISGLYQNHAGPDFFGGTMWDLHSVLKDIPPTEIGCVYDLRHATVEAGESWPMLYSMMQPHITAMSVKDFFWKEGKSQHAPLGEGVVSRKFYADLAKSDYGGPISVHVEYLKEGDTSEQLAALERDFSVLRKWMSA